MKNIDPKKIRKHLTPRNIFFSLIVLVLVLQTVQMYRAFGSFTYLEGRDTSLISEVGEIKQAYMELGQDLGEVRGLLRLPNGSYVHMDEIEDASEKDSDKNQDTLQLALFEYVDSLAEEKSAMEKLRNNEQLLANLSASETFQKFLTSGGLTVSSIEEIEGAKKLTVADDKGELMSLNMDLETGDLTRNTIKDSEKVKVTEAKKFESEQIKFLQSNKQKLQETRDLRIKKTEQIKALLASEAIVAKLADLGVTVDENWRLSNASTEVIGEIILDSKTLKVKFVDLKNTKNSNDKVVNLSDDLNVFLDNIDTRTLIEKKFGDALASVERTLGDKGFNIVLKENGLKIAKEKREDDDRIYFDIYDIAGNHLKSIVVEKDTGVVNITDPDGANAENILFFDPEFKKKT